MRNLLWKFIALIGVTGVGFMVVLQVMEGLSGVGELSSQQAAASDDPGLTVEPAPEAEPLPELPPLETTETIAMANPFPPLAEPEPSSAGAAVPFEPSPEPVPDDNPPFPTPEFGEPTPAEFPPEFPAPTESPALPPTEPAVPELGSPDLPILVPMSDESGGPDLEAFSKGPTTPTTGELPTPATPPGPIPAPSLGENNPFSEPVPTPAGDEPSPQKAAFDPYEPLPESPAEPLSSQTSDEPSAAEALGDLAFPASEPMPEPAGPSFPPSGAASQMISADPTPQTAATEGQPVIAPIPEASTGADPLENLPPSSASEVAPEPAPRVSQLEFPLPLPTETEPPKAAPPQAEPPNPEAAPDPFTAQEPPVDAPPLPAPPTNQSPGRATVRTPSASPEQPPKSSAPAFPEPQPRTPPAASLAPMPPVEKPAPEVKPLPNITAPLAGGLEMAPAAQGADCAVPGAKGPDCAVPALAISEAPPAAPFADPLDQLTFPNAAPPASVPEHTKPEHHLIPAANTEPAAPNAPTEPRTNSGPLPEINPSPLGAVGQGSTPPATPPQPASPPVAPLEETNAPETLASSGPQQPKLKIEKTAPPKAVLNQPMIYNILVRNVGASTAHQVIVEDQVPEGTTLTGTIPRGEMANNRLIWRLGSLNPGEEKKIAVRVIPTQEGQVGSVAKVSFVAEVAARTVVASPKLKLEMSGPGDAVIGDALTYHFQIENNGSGDASKVFLRNVLPEGLSHPSGNDLEYEVGLLKAGEKKEIDLTVNAVKAGEFSNTAMLVGAGGLKAESTAHVKILGDRLTITRTGPKRRYVGRRASYSNTIVNQSERKVEGIRVVESIPEGMEFVQATAGGQFDANNRTVTWTIAELGPKANQLLQLELLAKTEGAKASQVTAFDPNGTRAIVQSETTVDGYTALRLDVAEYEDPVDVGEQVGLRILATNRGTKATTNAVVKLTLPEEVEFVSAKGPVDFKRDGQTLTFNPIPSLDARGEMTFDLVLKSVKAGDARLRLEIGSDQMAKPLLREEGIRILAKRP